MNLQSLIARMHLGMNNLEVVAPMVGEVAAKKALLTLASMACVNVGAEILVRAVNSGNRDLARQAQQALAGSAGALWNVYWSDAPFADIRRDLQVHCWQLDCLSRRSLLPSSDADVADASGADAAQGDAPAPFQWQ